MPTGPGLAPWCRRAARTTTKRSITDANGGRGPLGGAMLVHDGARLGVARRGLDGEQGSAGAEFLIEIGGVVLRDAEADESSEHGAGCRAGTGAGEQRDQGAA